MVASVRELQNLTMSMGNLEQSSSANQPLKEWECRRECLLPLEHSRIQQEEGANVRRKEHRIPCCSRCTRCRLYAICDSLWPGSSPRGGGQNPGNCWQRRAVVSWRLSQWPWRYQ